MTAKERIIDFVRTLPDSATEFDIGRELLSFQVHEGWESAKNEPLTAHQNLDELMDQWLSTD